MILAGIALGLIVGLLVGGRLSNLIAVQLRWLPLFFVAVIARFGTEALLARGVGPVEAFRLPLLAGAAALLLTALWANRGRPGLVVVFVGTLSNAVVIALNGGRMPIWEPSLTAAGLTPADLVSPLHILLPASLDGAFLLHLGPFADIVPLPVPFVRNVMSVGDLFITAGLAFFLFATVVREQRPADEDERAGFGAGLSGSTVATRLHGVRLERHGVSAATGLVPGLSEASLLERPIFLGGAGSSLAGASAGTTGSIPFQPPAPAVPLGLRIRSHPYVRLALNPAFSAIWTSGVISLFGDRVHQFALALIVWQTTGSAVAVGLVFMAATLPNLLIGPVSGTLVDRWDQRQVLVVSDLLRAAVVVLIPIAAVSNIALVYPLVFLVTSFSLFFRPARESVMPRIVHERDLLTANSANWLAETLADIVGYPLAGLFVVFLGTALPLAFWFDAATYVVSAALILSVAIPPLQRQANEVAEGVLAEMRAGWRFLRGETVLLANTLQGVVGQFTNGILLALTLLYAIRALHDATAYTYLEAGIGIGNLIGGFAIGLLGGRFAKGRLVIAGYAAMGVCVAALSLVGVTWAAVGLAVGIGIANMVYVIPSQTLFQQRVPREMIGRVVGMRFSLVFGSMTLAMGLSGFLAEALGVTTVIGAFGVLTALAGLGGLLLPAVRDA